MSDRWLGKVLRTLLGCLLFIVTPRCEAQNLVPNPSFEENTACPVTIGFQGFSKPMHWERWNQSPEYFHACAGSLGGVDTLIRVPSNGFGFQYALHGDAYVGMYAYATSGGGVNYREYVGCQLLEPLEVGESYDLSFYTNVAVDGSYWWTRWACSNMGMLFTMQPNIWSGSSGPLFAFRNYAHLRSTEVISDTANWTLVSGSFVADSAYQFLVLGNFFNNALTDTLHIVPGNSLGAYYFVDGVCVGRSGQPCEFITGIEKPDFDSPMVWPNPVSEQVQVRTGAGTAWHVFDVTGRLMASGVSATEFMVLSVQDWAPGEYSMMLQGEGRRRIRFVVMR